MTNSLGYLAEHMDPANQFAPLFEAQLELREPDLVFVPPLDSESPKNFSSLVQGLINDIMKMAHLIPRIATHYDYPDYQVQSFKLQYHYREIFFLVGYRFVAAH